MSFNLCEFVGVKSVFVVGVIGVKSKNIGMGKIKERSLLQLIEDFLKRDYLSGVSPKRRWGRWTTQKTDTKPPKIRPDRTKIDISPIKFLKVLRKILRTPVRTKKICLKSFDKRTNKKLILTGYLIKPQRKKLCPTIVFNPGFGMTAYQSLPICHLLASLEYNVFVLNYRGVADSYGFVEIGKGEVDDVIAGIDWLERKGLLTRGLYLIGGSMGGAISFMVAARDRDKRVDGVIDICGYSNILAQFNYSSSSDILMLKDILAYAESRNISLEDITEEFKSRSPISWANKIDCPVLLLHGAEDKLVPAYETEALYKALKEAGKDVKKVITPGRGAHLMIGGPQENLISDIVGLIITVVEVLNFLERLEIKKFKGGG